MENLRKLFQIQTSNYKEIIMKDKIRNEKSKIEDIAFIEKLMNGKDLVMSGKDKVFSVNIKKSEVRLENFLKKLTIEEERATMDKIRKQKEDTRYTLESSTESNEYIPEEEVNNDDFELPIYQKRMEESTERKQNNGGKINLQLKSVFTFQLMM